MSKVTAKDDSKGSQSEPLKWEVFVTPGIPISTPERPAGVRETYFQAMASTLIYGKRDAILVDAFMTVEQANALADWVASKNKNLTTIYITHGHGDHWFGVGTILRRFPTARVVATPNTIKVMQGTPACMSLRSGSWLRATLRTTMSTFISSSRARRSDRSGSPRSTRSSRSTHAQLSLHTSDQRTTTVRGLSKRRGSTSAISTGWRKRRRPRKNSTTRCWSSIRPGSIQGGRCGARCARLSHRRGACPAASPCWYHRYTRLTLALPAEHFCQPANTQSQPSKPSGCVHLDHHTVRLSVLAERL